MKHSARDCVSSVTSRGATFGSNFLDRLPALAAELVQLDPKVIVSAPLPANLALNKATSTIPIVMATGADPVRFGLVQSLSHQGGNITGLANFAEQLASKQLDLMRELLPHLARIGTLVNVQNPLHVPQLQETQAAAAKASLALVRFDYLLSYGPNLSESYRRAAVFVDKILKGAKLADLPIERPTTIEFVFNLKAAKTLGLAIPRSVLARANEVIE